MKFFIAKKKIPENKSEYFVQEALLPLTLITRQYYAKTSLFSRKMAWPSNMKNQQHLPRTALFADEEQIAENEISEGNS